MSSVYNGFLTVSIFGQSHSPAIGVCIDGLPAGLPVDPDALNAFLARRAPGNHPWSTARKEADVPQILSGLSEGYTCGAPLAAILPNQNTRSSDYNSLRNLPRPGHADYTAQVKYGGYQDRAGGGHFSGRLTAPLCIAGGICAQLLAREGITLGSHIAAIAGIRDRAFDPAALDAATLQALSQLDFPVLDPAAGQAMEEAIARAKAQGDSVGGILECAAVGLPAGLGDPMLDGMENRIARLVFAIPAVKGLEFGAGFAAAEMTGREHNDSFFLEDGQVKTRTNRHGGILGGITSGMPLVFRAAVKPTPSIAQPQETVDLGKMEPAPLEIRGRHDPCIVPRAAVCMEAALAIALYDALLDRRARSPQEGYPPHRTLDTDHRQARSLLNG